MEMLDFFKKELTVRAINAALLLTTVLLQKIFVLKEKQKVSMDSIEIHHPFAVKSRDSVKNHSP